MTLTPGRQLGSYEILSPLGAGGMGEVYRARDGKLGREVAIKVLPDVFTRDPERLARFEREARLLATLNHPNIGSIYGLEESNGTRFLVLELVPGETLDEIIRGSGADAAIVVERTSRGGERESGRAGERESGRVGERESGRVGEYAHSLRTGGPLEVEEALKICRQIAEALEAAHEKGIIHRDLKPSNVKVTPDGKVKVLDFGLAKAFAPEESSPSLSMSPTLTLESMRTGVILGTAAYMSPEQARGKPLDKRTDIWSFGCVLYETFTGRQAFTGETVSDTLASILKTDPDWQVLPEEIPANIQLLLHRCLEKDRNRRLHDAGDARIEIEDALSKPFAGPQAVAASSPLPARKMPDYLAWALAALFFLGMVALAVPYFRTAPEQKPDSVKFFVQPPENAVVNFGAPGSGLAVSPDGRRVAFTAFSQSSLIIFVRNLSSLASQRLAGTETANLPFWSPDSGSIGFFAGGKLKKIDLSGGPPITLCDAVQGGGGTWNRDGAIVFNPQGGEGLYRVSAAGGAATAVTTLDPARGERRLGFPCFLPDGRHFLYFARSTQPQDDRVTYLASLDSKERKKLLSADSNAIYSPPGYLLFVRERTVMAQPFDTKRLQLTGEASPIAEQIGPQGVTSAAPVSVSQNGILAYASGGGAPVSQLTWYDRHGTQLGTAGPQSAYRAPAVSPDERRIAVERIDSQTGTGDIWVLDIARGSFSRFTSDPAIDMAPIWSPDGSRIAFLSTRDGPGNLYQKPSSGPGKEELLLKTNELKIPTDWSRDGRFILYESNSPKTKYDIWVLPLSGDRKPIPFLQTEFDERRGQFSPNGKWIAYASNESGIFQIYVQPFPATGAESMVSITGGDQPAWRRDGRELFYLGLDRKLMSVEVKTDGPAFEAGVPKPLFESPIPSIISALRNYYCPSADGQRFLLYAPIQQSNSFPITVVVNWTAELKR